MAEPVEQYEFPLTSSQKQLWFLHALDPENTAYNIPFEIEIRGNLDTAALGRALQQLVDDNEVLRTSFKPVAGVPVQRVQAHLPFHLYVRDLSSETEAARSQRLLELAGATAKHHFDHAEPCLMHVVLAKLGEEDHRLYLVLDHIIVDHQAVLNLGKQLAANYTDALAGRRREPRQNKLDYPDFAAWHAEVVDDAFIAAKIAHWREELAGLPHSLSLITDHPRPKFQTFNGAELELALESGLAGRLLRFARDSGLSLYTVALAATALTLSRLTGQKGVIVGTPFANRNDEELEDVVGLFMNVLPIGVRVDLEQTFTALCEEVRRRVIRAQAHQDTPLQTVIDALLDGRDASSNPLVQVLFTVQDAPMRLELEGLDCITRPIHNGGAKLDLSLWFWEQNGDVRALLEYNTDLFEETTVRGFFDQLQNAIAVCISASERKLSDIDLLSETDRTRLLEWQGRVVEQVGPGTLPECLFAAERDWHRPAVVCGRVTFTHGELRVLMQQVANRLYRQGIRAGDRIGVLMDRRADLVPTLLGILQLGAAYVPLDPQYPRDRILYIVEDSGARLICAHADTRGVLDSGEAGDLTFLEIDTCWDEIRAENETPDHPRGPDPDSIAYIMHTSGSTGRPKGVLVAHRNVVNLLNAIERQPGMTAADVLVAVTTICFDTSIMDLYLPIMVGSRMVLAERETIVDGEALKALLETSEATLMQATPSSWRLLRQAGWNGGSGFRAICTGEPMPQDLCRELFVTCAELWNLYGPTETTVWCTGTRIEDPDAPITIGRPIDNDRAYILNEHLQLQPVGVPGELYIGGRGVTAGYLNQPELTAQKFVPDPFAADGSRMYATGDLARWTRDGRIEHLGRIDTQVKVRGYRIELGEIETNLVAHASVQEAVVNAWRVGTEDHRLVAYLIPVPGETIQPSELRKHLRARLPDYMIPPHFVTVKDIPLTPSGKVDRKRLPDPAEIGIVESVAFDPPTGPTEEAIAAVWSDVLGVAQIDRNANFFDIGGHSLIAFGTIHRIEQRLGVALDAKLLILENLATLAALIDAQAAQPGGLDVDADSRTATARNRKVVDWAKALFKRES